MFQSDATLELSVCCVEGVRNAGVWGCAGFGDCGGVLASTLLGAFNLTAAPAASCHEDTEAEVHYDAITPCLLTLNKF